MDPQLRATAEARLEHAAAALELSDPRPPYRERLRHLREVHPAAFQRAVDYYENDVLPAMTAGDAIAAWLDYARVLASTTAEGALHVIDETGRAALYNSQLSPRSLVLFIPEDTSEAVLVAAQPLQVSRPQQATLDLLVGRKLALS
jgi:hypothetical protein